MAQSSESKPFRTWQTCARISGYVFPLKLEMRKSFTSTGYLKGTF